jgi:double-strand break repair protein MRE11
LEEKLICKVETTGVKEMTNPVRFGQAFIGKVANPKDILQYYRKRKPAEKSGSMPPAVADTAESKVNADAPEMKDEDDDEEDISALTTRDKLNRLRMHDLVQQHLKAQNLEILVEDGMEDAVMRFVEKDDRDAIKE